MKHGYYIGKDTVIGYDSSNEPDVSCLCLGTKNNGKITITEVLYGEEADHRYKDITRHQFGTV